MFVYSIYRLVKETCKMLHFVLVLLVAQSAFAAPSVTVVQESVNNVAQPRDNGNLVNSYLTDAPFSILDNGETNVYVLTAQNVLRDMANSPDNLSQAIAVGQTINLLAELATGNSGDACEYAALVDAAASGNAAACSNALRNYVNRVAYNIDVITNIAINPVSLRNVNGRSTGCRNGGRVYNFEASWDRVLNNANPYTIGLLNEQYCAARRLYNSSTVRNNNGGAALSAAATPQAARLMQITIRPVANFLRVVANGDNPAQAGAVAKQAIAQAVSYVNV